MRVITNDDPVMARAMLAVQEVCAVALDRLVRRGLELGHRRVWVVLRVGLPGVDPRVTVHGPFAALITARRQAHRLRGQTFVLGPVEAP